MASAAGQSNIRATVKGTAAVINVVIIIILDEIYAKVARWLTILGEDLHTIPVCRLDGLRQGLVLTTF